VATALAPALPLPLPLAHKRFLSTLSRDKLKVVLRRHCGQIQMLERSWHLIPRTVVPPSFALHVLRHPLPPQRSTLACTTSVTLK
jgi:hypothetical protein